MLFSIGFVLSLEISTRIDQALRYDAPFFGVYNYESALFEHDEYGIRGRPGGVYEKWQLNALGLRGPEANVRPDGERLRIVTLGASETFGLYESKDSEWPRALERELLSQGVSNEVLNGAIAGMTVGAQLRHLRHRLLPLSPDVVIWVVHYAAFAGLDPVSLNALAAERPEPPAARGLFAGLVPRIVRRLREAMLPRLPEPVRDWVESARIRFQLTNLRLRMGDRFGDLTRVSAGERAAFEDFLASLKRETHEAGASLVVVLPPRRLDDKSLRLQYLSFPHVARSWLDSAFEEFAESAGEAGAEAALSVADLRQVFSSDVDEFMMDAVHFNDAGALAFARGIAPCVVTKQCLPKRLSQIRAEYSHAALRAQ